jgi:hypothetical protein
VGAFSTADLDRIKRAIASGALSVSYDDGRSVRYRDFDDLLRAKAMIERELGVLASPIRKTMGHEKGVEAGLAGEGPRSWEWE